MATLGLFAYLGRETRLFLSGMGIKDIDEQTKDFLRCFTWNSLIYLDDLEFILKELLCVALQLLRVREPSYIS